jgi:hypothetical protein
MTPTTMTTAMGGLLLDLSNNKTSDVTPESVPRTSQSLPIDCYDYAAFYRRVAGGTATESRLVTRTPWRPCFDRQTAM